MVRMTTNRLVRRVGLAVVLLAGPTVAGCAAKRNMVLEQARTAYMQAQQNPAITANAPVALHEAEAALRRAEQTWENTKDEKEVTHLAYLTEKRVDVARATAEQKMAEAEAQRLNDEREKVVIEARTREAERARQATQARAHEAEEATARAKRLEQELNWTTEHSYTLRRPSSALSF